MMRDIEYDVSPRLPSPYCPVHGTQNIQGAVYIRVHYARPVRSNRKGLTIPRFKKIILKSGNHGKFIVTRAMCIERYITILYSLNFG